LNSNRISNISKSIKRDDLHKYNYLIFLNSHVLVYLVSYVHDRDGVSKYNINIFLQDLGFLIKETTVIIEKKYSIPVPGFFYIKYINTRILAYISSDYNLKFIVNSDSSLSLISRDVL